MAAQTAPLAPRAQCLQAHRLIQRRRARGWGACAPGRATGSSPHCPSCGEDGVCAPGSGQLGVAAAAAAVHGCACALHTPHMPPTCPQRSCLSLSICCPGGGAHPPGSHPPAGRYHGGGGAGRGGRVSGRRGPGGGCRPRPAPKQRHSRSAHLGGPGAGFGRHGHRVLPAPPALLGPLALHDRRNLGPGLERQARRGRGSAAGMSVSGGGGRERTAAEQRLVRPAAGCAPWCRTAAPDPSACHPPAARGSAGQAAANSAAVHSQQAKEQSTKQSGSAALRRRRRVLRQRGGGGVRGSRAAELAGGCAHLLCPCERGRHGCLRSVSWRAAGATVGCLMRRLPALSGCWLLSCLNDAPRACRP